jgi:hypothetical protein
MIHRLVQQVAPSWMFWTSLQLPKQKKPKKVGDNVKLIAAPSGVPIQAANLRSWEYWRANVKATYKLQGVPGIHSKK